MTAVVERPVGARAATAWHSRATCNGTDAPGLFYPQQDRVSGGSPLDVYVRAAIAIGQNCRMCPVRGECLADVTSQSLIDRHGVWGGQLWSGRREPYAWPDGDCGTTGGLLAHLRAAEPLCAPCETARVRGAAEAARRRRRRAAS